MGDGAREGERRLAGLSPRWWWAILYATSMTTVIAAAYLSRVPASTGGTLGFGRGLLWQSGVYGTWALLVPVIAWLGRRIGIGVRSWLTAAAIFTVASLLVVPLHAAWTAWLDVHFMPPAGGASGGAILGALVARLPVDLLLYWAIVGVLFAAGYHAGMLARERAAGRLEAALARAELHALRAQLEPHFLFNALQAISALIPRDPAGAQQMTARLGDLLRTTLRRVGVSDVTLDEELELLGHYVAIERVRFGDRLVVHYDIAPDVRGCTVPDLALQPLVENAIRHGIGPQPEGGTVLVRARRVDTMLELSVTDDGAGLPAGWNQESATGLGLTLTLQRLQHTYHGEASFEVRSASPRGTEVRIRIPLRAGGAGDMRGAAAAAGRALVS